MVNGPFLVVSDTHFGLEPGTYERFQNFLKWLGTIKPGESVPIPTADDPHRVLKTPQTIALLGDILELWGPDREDFTESVKEAFGGFEMLSTLPCKEMIYISGNHDHLTSWYNGPYKLGDSPLEVCADHYPDDRGGVEIGGERYFFLHGHQFDPIFKHRSMLQFLDFIGLAAWNSHEASPWLGRVGFVFLVLALAFLTPLLSLIRGSLWFVAPVLFVVSAILVTLGLAWVWRQITKLWPFIHRLSPEPSVPAQHANYDAKRSPLKPSDFPRYVEYQATRRGRTRGLSVQELIEQGYYSKRRDSITAQNVVLGHTHVPEITAPDYHGTGKRFINDGSWVSGEGHTHDTFVYIDDKGPCLLQWRADGTVQRLAELEEGA